MQEEKRTWRRRFCDWVRGVDPPRQPPPCRPLVTPTAGVVGICCSGGGIRSASFNLGALQVLQEEGELREARYVSAVSGGCYIAASYASVASKSEPRLFEDGPPVYAPGSPEEQHLRNNSTYLAPGLAGKVRLAVRLLLGLLVNLALIGLAVYLVAVPFGWFLGWLYDPLAGQRNTGSLEVHALTTWALAGLVVAGVGFALPDLVCRLRNRTEGPLRWVGTERLREVWSYRLLALATLGFLFLVAAPQAILWAREAGDLPLDSVLEALPSGAGTGEGSKDAAQTGTSLFATLNLGAILATVLGAAWAFVVRRRSFFALAAGAVAGPLVVVSAFLWLANLGATDTGFASGRGLAIALAAAAVLWAVSDLTQWSLHPFYRRRLSSAFFVRRLDQRSVEEVDYCEPFHLSALKETDDFPELIVCAAANVSDLAETPPGRAATPFVFTRETVGGPLVETVETPDYEQQASRTRRDITLRAAVAMSGAAVSPAMGKKSIRALGFLMALVNVRLGVWVPNPRRVKDVRQSRLAPLKRAYARVGRGRQLLGLLRGGARTRAVALRSSLATFVGRQRATPIYLFKEMLGLTRVNDRFLYVTDGGHYDNLGLVELLRRGCTTIYCFDGGGDPSGTFRALGEAVALARSDLQVEIDIKPDEIAPDKKSRISKECVAVGTIHYRVTPSGELAADRDEEDREAGETYTGRLVYCRTAVTEDAPWDVKAYHEKSRRFPYHSTLDQLFDDQKFEAYRALGAHAARQAVRALRDPDALRSAPEARTDDDAGGDDGRRLRDQAPQPV
jgi:predicted membrane protein